MEFIQAGGRLRSSQGLLTLIPVGVHKKTFTRSESTPQCRGSDYSERARVRSTSPVLVSPTFARRQKSPVIGFEICKNMRDTVPGCHLNVKRLHSYGEMGRTRVRNAAQQRLTHNPNGGGKGGCLKRLPIK